MTNDEAVRKALEALAAKLWERINATEGERRDGVMDSIYELHLIYMQHEDKPAS